MPPRTVLNRVYDKEYFSGTQAALYIGDVFVDEIVGYSFAVNEVKTPIFGYASQLYDAVSKGTVIIHGNFAINFKESAYLYLILNRYKRLADDIDFITDGALNLGTSEGELVIRAKKNPRIPSPFQNNKEGGQILRTTIERIINGQVTNEERFNFYQSLAGFATVAGAPDRTFEDYAEAFEDRVWGTPPIELDGEIRRPTDSYFDGFEMYFTFGDFNNPQANHTVQRITGVHLTRSSKAVNVSGEPIMEQYEFFGRNSY